MFFFERKAFVEFLDFSKVRITTPFRQKDFSLDDVSEKQVIDLIDLKIKLFEKNSKFIAYVEKELPGQFSVSVQANGGTSALGYVSFEERSKLFKTKILE